MSHGEPIQAPAASPSPAAPPQANVLALEVVRDLLPASEMDARVSELRRVTFAPHALPVPGQVWAMETVSSSFEDLTPAIRDHLYKMLAADLAGRLPLEDLRADQRFVAGPSGQALRAFVAAQFAAQGPARLTVRERAAVDAFRTTPHGRRLLAALQVIGNGARFTEQAGLWQTPRMLRRIADRLEAKEAAWEAAQPGGPASPEARRLGGEVILLIAPTLGLDESLNEYIDRPKPTSISDPTASKWSTLAYNSVREQRPTLRLAMVRTLGDGLAQRMTEDELRTVLAYLQGMAGKVLKLGAIAEKNHTEPRALTDDEFKAVTALENSPAGKKLYAIMDRLGDLYIERAPQFLGSAFPTVFRHGADEIEAELARTGELPPDL